MACSLCSPQHNGGRGEGTTANGPINITGTFQCPECTQKFDTEKANNVHFKFTHDRSLVYDTTLVAPICDTGPIQEICNKIMGDVDRTITINAVDTEFLVTCNTEWKVADLIQHISAAREADPRDVRLVDVGASEVLDPSKPLRDYTAESFTMVIDFCKRSKCGYCRGTGEDHECGSCGGSGEGHGRYNSRCKVCKGSGRVATAFGPCRACHGKGLM